MRIRFWGTRGSIPTPGRHTNAFGGNTSCVEVRGAGDRAIILDCGTGARPLGLDLLGRGAPLLPIHILITHTHWDHIQGFPFFVPAYAPGARLTFYGTRGLERTLASSLAEQMRHTYFPVQLSQLPARLDFVELGEQGFHLGPLRVRTQVLNHTAAAIGYRFEQGGLAFAYCTDHEPFRWPWARSPGGGILLHPGEERHMAFFEGVDLLIHDAQYSGGEYRAKHGWGHSPIEYVVEIAAQSGVRRLVLFHHDPLHGDAWVRQHTAAARRQARALGSPLEVVAASEGLEIRLPASRGPARPGPPARPAGGRIVVTGPSPDPVKAVRDTLAGEGYQIAVSADGHLAELVARRRPHLIIIAGGQSTAAMLDAVTRARREPWGARLPILVVAGPQGPPVPDRAPDDLTDVLPRPFNPAFLRPRVRAWLSRVGPGSSARRARRGGA